MVVTKTTDVALSERRPFLCYGRAMVRFGVVVLVAVGCAGRSIGTEEAGGTSGAGASSGASGGRGGATTGGTGGSVATGGSMQGGTAGVIPIGGVGGGVSVGGATTGGTGGSSMAGAAGAGATCGLPLDPGRCLALQYPYGFDPQRGHCVRFLYGGCDGNENRFDTLAECEAVCGGSNIGGCPEMRPDQMDICDPSGLRCIYSGLDGCLCRAENPFECSKIDPQCPPTLQDVPPPEEDGECVGEGCVSRVVLPPRTICDCGAGRWGCASG
jgi:hypothetical protein